MNRIAPLFFFATLAACANDPITPTDAPVEELESVDSPREGLLDHGIASDACGMLAGGRTQMEVPGFPDRPVWIQVPESEGPRDAIVMLHAGGGTPTSAARTTRFHRAAAERDMVAVYPAGIDRSWAAGGSDALDDDSTAFDDVEYLSAVSEALTEDLCVDRVMAAGFGLGGMMAQRWACEGKGVDAVLSMAGPRLDHECPNSPVPALLVHGLEDRIVPVDGESPISEQTWPGGKDTLEAWLMHDGWDREEPSSRVAGPYTCATFAGEATVTQCLVTNWGHAWPGGANVQGPALDLSVQSLNWFAREVHDLAEPSEI